ncbi:MAG: ribosomal protein S18-alanine N-acetyltransferase [Chloroflexota bacterium]
MSPKPNLLLRYMTVADLPQVTEIDRLSFEIPWSEKSYRYEINESSQSFMVVLEWNRQQTATRWQRWLKIHPYAEHRIVGYGGMWHIAGEAHISTIAVHPKGRGRGWGEILLAGMVQRGIVLEAEEVALEVRVSNQRAQRLYQKYAFRTVDVKQRYYRNNGEDAYDMRMDIQNSAICTEFEAHYKALFTRHQLVDYFSPYTPPHQK